MFNLRNRFSPIGVALDGDAVRMLQLERRGDAMRVIAAAEIARSAEDPILPTSKDVAERVKRALKTAGFRGHRAVVSLPSEHIAVRHVKVDSTETRALHDTLLFELEPSFPGDTPIVQHIDVGEITERGEKRHEVIVLAAGLKPVEDVLGFLECADLEPVALDAESCALVRCFMQRRRRSADADRQTAIVHVGETATTMTITAAGHPMFMKQFPLGATQLFDAIFQRVGLARDEARICPSGERLEDERDLATHVTQALRLPIDSLALELSACLRYHAASRRAGGALEIFLSGHGAELPGFADALADTLAQPISRPDPFCESFSGVTADRRIAPHFPVWNLPLGLALREVAA